MLLISDVKCSPLRGLGEPGGHGAGPQLPGRVRREKPRGSEREAPELRWKEERIRARAP